MRTMLLITALAAIAGSAYAKPARPAKAVAKCPVTGEKITNPAAPAGGKSVYKGATYAFCCPACKPRFDKTPAKYVKNAAKGIYDKM